MANKTIHGKDVNIYILSGLAREVIAFTRGISLDRSADVIEVTTRSSDGWKEQQSSFKEFSISVDGLYASDESSYNELENAFNSGEELPFEVVLPDGRTYDGNVIVTSMPLGADYSDALTFSADLQGTGPLKVTNKGSLANSDAPITKALDSVAKKETK